MIRSLDLRRSAALLSWTLLMASAAQAAAVQHGDEGVPFGEDDDPNRLTNEYLPPQIEDFPERPEPIFELGNGFNEPGPINDPIRLPTGAIWSPSFLVWGNLRSGVATIDRNDVENSEWANRLDLFAELRVSPTERFVIGMRPLDKDGEFTGYDLDGERNGEDEDFLDGFNTDIQTFFFEGDFGEIFPNLDPEETRALDFGFGLGRQPLNFQDGILIQDVLDAITITRNSVRKWGASNIRATGILAWNDIERGNNVEDDSATLVGLLTAIDLVDNYVEVDLVGTFSSNEASGDGLYLGVGSTQRIGGTMNSTFRLNASTALDEGSAAVDDGALLTSILSWTPHHTHDNLYFGSYLGVDNFTSAARSPVAGGPLANIGVLYAATGLGTVGAPISNAANDVVGGALGYQQFFNHGRSQIIYEVAARVELDSDNAPLTGGDSFALGARYRRAIGQHTVLTVDGFAGNREEDDGFFGGRLELLWKF